MVKPIWDTILSKLLVVWVFRVVSRSDFRCSGTLRNYYIIVILRLLLFEMSVDILWNGRLRRASELRYYELMSSRVTKRRMGSKHHIPQCPPFQYAPILHTLNFTIVYIVLDTIR